jgi:hypothetical protein
MGRPMTPSPMNPTVAVMRAMVHRRAPWRRERRFAADSSGAIGGSAVESGGERRSVGNDRRSVGRGCPWRKGDSPLFISLSAYFAGTQGKGDCPHFLFSPARCRSRHAKRLSAPDEKLANARSPPRQRQALICALSPLCLLRRPGRAAPLRASRARASLLRALRRGPPCRTASGARRLPSTGARRLSSSRRAARTRCLCRLARRGCGPLCGSASSRRRALSFPRCSRALRLGRAAARNTGILFRIRAGLRLVLLCLRVRCRAAFLARSLRA